MAKGIVSGTAHALTIKSTFAHPTRTGAPGSTEWTHVGIAECDTVILKRWRAIVGHFLRMLQRGVLDDK